VYERESMVKLEARCARLGDIKGSLEAQMVDRTLKL
jgi:hypothetical protein